MTATTSKSKVEDISYEWSFRYEGPSSGLEAALSKYALTITNGEAKTQFAGIQSMLNTEQAMSSSTVIRVAARGDENAPANNVRNLAIEFNVLR